MIPAAVRLSSVLTRPVRIPAWVAVLLLAAVVAAGTVMWQTVRDRGRPAIVRGVLTAVNVDGTAIGFSADNGRREGEGLVLLGDVPWTDASGADYGGSRPTCLAADSAGQRVELGIIELHGTGGWPTKAVVWVHCLS